ncbi:rRNA pseudouridine synthase [Myxococcota bacterium]|nr:rRNA pseudouridine synthase [Myxococcota bacterium]MBU1380279.1 rRNA pseudouridine synthase [Myxococcota bacterium]MBU1496391.1 rRNA pseudouridine synthase [Myxococcota bacterium]
MEKKERINKFIARCGVASRRKADELIKEGRVKIGNTVVTELGTMVDPRSDKVRVDGTRISPPEDYVVIALNKPANVLSTVSDPEGRATVLELLPDLQFRIYPVGRLDWASEGLILLTNDGELTQALTHPNHDVSKIYEVKIKGHVVESTLKRIREGVDLPDGKTRPARVEIVKVLQKNTWLRITVQEGRNHLVRKIFEHFGHDVIRLVRTQIGSIKLGTLQEGKYRYLNKPDIAKLKREAGLTS